MTAPASPSTGERGLLKRSRALDGLRGLALVWVVTYHFTSSEGPFPGGWVGLDVFFALSGFLITAMILDERRAFGKVDLKLFYARRALRLLPALLVMLTAWTVVLLLFHDTTWIAATPGGDGSGDPVDVGAALRQVVIVLLYGVNWVYALGSGDAPLAHLWSLAVEEQFYLVWPVTLLLVLLLPEKRQKWTVGALALLSALLPLAHWDGGGGNDRIYFGTDTRAVGMLLGALAAITWHQQRRSGKEAAKHGGARAWGGLLLILLILLTVGNTPAKFIAGPSVAALLAVQVILHLVDAPEGKLARMHSNRVLVWLGQRSYAVYLWHYLLATWLNPLTPWISIPLGVSASLLLAHLSWVHVEAPALRYARRYRPKGGEAEELSDDPYPAERYQDAPEGAAKDRSLQGGRPG